MKDYKFIKFVSKKLAIASSCGKTSISCHFPYGQDSLLGTFFSFEKRQSSFVLFDLQNIYEVHARNRFASCDAMVKTLVNKKTYFEIVESNGRLLIASNLRINKIDHVCSQALANVSIMIFCINELLHFDAEYFSEEEWRTFHREYLDRNRKKNSYMGGGCISLFALSVAGFILAVLNLNGTLRLGGIVIREIHLGYCFMGVIAGLICLIIGIAFLIKSRYYKSHLKRSLAAKKYE